MFNLKLKAMNTSLLEKILTSNYEYWVLKDAVKCIELTPEQAISIGFINPNALKPLIWKE